jgi:hypothetical protein
VRTEEEINTKLLQLYKRLRKDYYHSSHLKMEIDALEWVLKEDDKNE